MTALVGYPTVARANEGGERGEPAARQVAIAGRAGLLGGGAFGGAALLGLTAEPAEAQSRSDVAILNFALTREYLEAAFYAEAVRGGALKGELRTFARVVGSHEAAHVRALRKTLGRRAVGRPKFDFRGTTENRNRFVQTAIALEETGAAAYKGQAPLIDSDAVLAAALTIHSVEARHTAWIRDIAGLNPAPLGLDPAATRKRTLARVARTGFIVRPGRAPRRRRKQPSDD